MVEGIIKTAHHDVNIPPQSYNYGSAAFNWPVCVRMEGKEEQQSGLCGSESHIHVNKPAVSSWMHSCDEMATIHLW